MPIFFGKEEAQKDLIDDLEFQYAEIAKKNRLSIGMFVYYLYSIIIVVNVTFLYTFFHNLL
jgi:hypothetical protein